MNGRAVGLVRGATSRMATMYYGILRALRMQNTLLATIHQAKFVGLPKNARINAAIFDIQNQNFFKALFTILMAVLDTLIVLRACDKNEPMMDKIYYLCHQTTESIKRSKSALNDTEVFDEFDCGDSDDLDEEEQEMFGTSHGEKVEVKE
jgi:hypothetical protein